MRINGASIVKSLTFITILFVVFVFGAYFIKRTVYNNSKDYLSLKSNDSLVVQLNNTITLSDRLALENDKNSVSSEVFKNIKFEIVNNNSNNVNYELYITKKEKVDNEIDGKFIKIFLVKQNGDILNGYDVNNVPNYDNLNAIGDMPGSRILYRGTIKGNSSEKFDFKTWISDSYNSFENSEEFNYSIHVRVI